MFERKKRWTVEIHETMYKYINFLYFAKSGFFNRICGFWNKCVPKNLSYTFSKYILTPKFFFMIIVLQEVLPSRHNYCNRRAPTANPDSIDSGEPKVVRKHWSQILNNVQRIGGPRPIHGKIPVKVSVLLVLYCVRFYRWTHIFRRSYYIEWNGCRCNSILPDLKYAKIIYFLLISFNF